MQDQQQFEQLMMLYTQLKNGALEISKMIQNEDYDGAITMIKSRQDKFLTCKCIRKYLKLTPVQETKINELLEELKFLEEKNISKLQTDIDEIKLELKQAQQTQKINRAYQNLYHNNYSNSLDIKE